MQKLLREDKIELSDSFVLITSIIETEKEYVYVPNTQPWTVEPWTYPSPSTPNTPWWPNSPWYQYNTITCEKPNENNAISYVSDKPFWLDSWYGSLTN